MGGCIAGALAGGLLVSWAKGGFDRVELFLGGRLAEATLVELLTIVLGGAAGLAVGIGAWVALARRSGNLAEAELVKVSGRN